MVYWGFITASLDDESPEDFQFSFGAPVFQTSEDIFDRVEEIFEEIRYTYETNYNITLTFIGYRITSIERN